MSDGSLIFLYVIVLKNRLPKPVHNNITVEVVVPGVMRMLFIYIIAPPSSPSTVGCSTYIVILTSTCLRIVQSVCQPCFTIGGHSAEAYGLRMTGEGLTYRDRLCQRVHCPECDADLAAGSLETHRKIQHRVGQGDLRVIPSHPLYLTMTYRICLPWTARDITWSVGGAQRGPQVGAPSWSTSCTAACGTC